MSFGTGSFGALPFGTASFAGTLQVINVAPVPPAVLTPLQEIRFDVTSKFDFRRVLVFVGLSGKPPELVHDGDNFAKGYAESTRTPVGTKRWRYSIKRSRGWTSAPQPRIYAFDVTGAQL